MDNNSYEDGLNNSYEDGLNNSYNGGLNNSLDVMLACVERGGFYGATVETYYVVFACFSSISVLLQLVFLGVVIRDKRTPVSVPGALFLLAQLLFLVSYCGSYIIQQAAYCGRIELTTVMCRTISWLNRFSYTSCILMLLVSWTSNACGSKMSSFILTVSCGMAYIPYIVFTNIKVVYLLVDGTRSNVSYTATVCELTGRYGKSIETSEVVCGTVVTSILLILKCSYSVIKFRKIDKNKEVHEHSTSGCLCATSTCDVKIRGTSMFLLKKLLSFTFLIFLIPTRCFNFVLFLLGYKTTVPALETIYDSFNTQLSMFFVIMPFFHYLTLVPVFVAARLLDEKNRRKWASKPFERRIPIRRQTPTSNISAILDDFSTTATDNSEVDNGSTICEGIRL